MNRNTIKIETESHRQAKDTTAVLLDSPKNAKRLRGAIASITPKRLVFETTEDLKRALGI